MTRKEERAHWRSGTAAAPAFSSRKHSALRFGFEFRHPWLPSKANILGADPPSGDLISLIGSASPAPTPALPESGQAPNEFAFAFGRGPISTREVPPQAYEYPFA
jgi:hypothetical protein